MTLPTVGAVGFEFLFLAADMDTASYGQGGKAISAFLKVGKRSF